MPIGFYRIIRTNSDGSTKCVSRIPFTKDAASSTFMSVLAMKDKLASINRTRFYHIESEVA
jgi:hypothetical protein